MTHAALADQPQYADGIAVMNDRKRNRRKPVKIAPKPKPKEREEKPIAGLLRWLRGAETVTVRLER